MEKGIICGLENLHRTKFIRLILRRKPQHLPNFYNTGQKTRPNKGGESEKNIFKPKAVPCCPSFATK